MWDNEENDDTTLTIKYGQSSATISTSDTSILSGLPPLSASYPIRKTNAEKEEEFGTGLIRTLSTRPTSQKAKGGKIPLGRAS